MTFPISGIDHLTHQNPSNHEPKDKAQKLRQLVENQLLVSNPANDDWISDTRVSLSREDKEEFFKILKSKKSIFD